MGGKAPKTFKKTISAISKTDTHFTKNKNNENNNYKVKFKKRTTTKLKRKIIILLKINKYTLNLRLETRKIH